jgi:methylmalonyl-CoA carboxyltransferase 1.3S subunit
LKLQITIDGRAYAVDVEVLEDDESPETPSYAPHHTGSALLGGTHTQSHNAGWDAEGRECHSPLMGLVIKVNVKPGQQVEAGEILLVLEAMKMETHITAPRTGTVKNVFVAQGNPVKQNQILAELE